MPPLTPREAAPPPSRTLGGFVTSPTNPKSSAPFISTAATSETATSVSSSTLMDNHQLSPNNNNNMNMNMNMNNNNMNRQGAGPNLTMNKLRAALEEAEQRDATAKAALAKSDAVILELRSSIRQLKRSVEQLQRDKDVSDEHVAHLQQELQQLEITASQAMRNEQEMHGLQVHKLKSQLQVSETQSKEQVVGEMQVQLDRAHAQILTADMVRKELEDTLEAEQYTWELRVQDQERQLVQMQEECKTVEEDLEECRVQWREAEQGWSEENRILQEQLQHRDGDDVTGKLNLLVKEREELQGCLDEAMRELEAVDQELRQNPNVLEPLQHLYRWLLDRSGKDDRDIPSDVNQLVQQIEELIEDTSTDSLKVAELEANLSVYRGDLKAREESSSELRASLKEAVALLKPLQDAVAKTDKEKQQVEKELEQVRQQRDELESRTKSPDNAHSQPGDMPSGEEQHERGGFGSRSKRDEKQEELKKMLSGAQSRFQALHNHNHAVVEDNETLQNRIDDLERQVEDLKSHSQESIKRNVASELNEAAIQQLEENVKAYSQELERKELEVEHLQKELQHAQDSQAPSDHEALKLQLEELDVAVYQKREIESELHRVKSELVFKSEAERILNESLKEALSLLRPLQMHLETAEQEKKVVVKQLKSAKKKLARLENNTSSESRSLQLSVPDDQASDLELVIQGLEYENSQLRPQQSKLQGELVETKSRYEVTQRKLESAAVERHALVDALELHEHREGEMMEELVILRKKLEKSDHELENAKYIATSALMKVEELTMADISSSVAREQEIAYGSPSQVQRLIADHAHPSEVSRLKLKLDSLQQEVESARDLNESLEESIQERDRMLHALAESQSPRGGSGQSPRQSPRDGGQKVSWGT